MIGRSSAGDVFVLAVGTGLLLGVGSVAAEAGRAASPVAGFGPLYEGYNYDDQAYVDTEGGGAPYAVGQTIVFAPKTTTRYPVGYVGASAETFWNGYACYITSYSYNQTRVNSFQVQPPTGGDCGAGTYKSRGVAKGYTGQGSDPYSANYTFTSPNQNYSP